MTAKVIDGVAVAAHIRSDLKSRVSSLLAKGITPGLAVIVAGADPASAVYVRNKIRACAEVSIKSFRYDLGHAVHRGVTGSACRLTVHPGISGDRAALVVRG